MAYPRFSISEMGYPDEPDQNTLRIWNNLQGYTSATEESYIPRRDLNSRHITVENSSPRPIAVALATYCCGPTPKIQFHLKGGEIRHLGINLPDQPLQYLYVLDPITGSIVGTQKALATNSNSFVLRDGLQGWYVQAFKRTAYRAQF